MGGGGGEVGSNQVTIPHDFYIGIFQVTQVEWETVMGSNPSWLSRNGDGKNKVKKISDADLKLFPVEQVSCDDLQVFLQKLNARENAGDWLYRLPTEEEWEYSCRGAASSKADCSYDFYLDKPTNDLSAGQINFDGNHPVGSGSVGTSLKRTSKVGSYKPNSLGIYDLHGNVWEWTSSGEGSFRVMRGGSWGSFGADCRAAYRKSCTSSWRHHHHGLRLALVPSGH